MPQILNALSLTLHPSSNADMQSTESHSLAWQRSSERHMADNSSGSMRNETDILPRPKINAILRPSTQTNVTCKMTKIPLIFYEKDLDIGGVWESSSPRN
jgi:hypothetical protein